MRRIGLVALIVLVALVAAIAFLLLRPPAVARSTTDPDVTVECAAFTGFDEAACAAWGDGLLERGAPSTTFELRDVVRIRLVQGPFGGDCSVEWFLGRYPDEPVWTEDGTCGASASR